MSPVGDMTVEVTGAGIEPAARALKVRCSTTELPGPGANTDMHGREMQNAKCKNLTLTFCIVHFAFRRTGQHLIVP
jgi:hypothetical protein